MKHAWSSHIEAILEVESTHKMVLLIYCG